jgi:hypothetical protein
MATPIIPNLDNSNTGYAFNTTTTPENYYNTDFNFPLAEFTAKLDDDTLQKLISIINRSYQTNFTLAKYKNTGPSGDCIKVYNIIKTVAGYKRLLYNYSLPLINLSILMSKVDISNLSNPNLLESMYPVNDGLYNFMHIAIEKLFNIVVSEGRTYSEMSLQMFGSTHDDGLDDENKLTRLIDFWSDIFDRTTADRAILHTLYQAYINPTIFLKYKLNVTITGTQLTRGTTNLVTNADIITYFEEFTLPNTNIDCTTNRLNSVNMNASNTDIINTLKLISAGYYDTIQHESVLSPLNPAIFRNCYSLNPTFIYSDFKTTAPTQCVTYGDYILLLVFKLLPHAFNNYINATMPSTTFIYNDIVTIVSIFKLTVNASSHLPSMIGFDCKTLFGADVFSKTLDDIYIDIKSAYSNDFVPCLLELFNYTPKSSTLSFINGTTVTTGVNNVINFYNAEAITDLFENDTIKHSLFQKTPPTYNMLFSSVKSTKQNQIISLVIFSLLAQQYSNKNINIFDNKEFIRELFDINSASYFKLTGNLLIMIKATLILLDRVYCYFIKLFGKDNMILFSGTFDENSGLDVSIIRTLLGINAIPDQNFDPIDYMGYLSFSYLTIYNYDFARELIQDLVCSLVIEDINNITCDVNNSLKGRLNDVERKLNYLMTGNGTFTANNGFHAYKHMSLNTQL